MIYMLIVNYLNRKFISTCCLLLAELIFNFNTLPVSVSAVSTFNYELSYDVDAYVLYEINTDTIVLSSNSDDRLAPASITKIMTLILIYDALAAGDISKDDLVTVSEHAAGMGGSQIYLEANEEMSVENLIKSIVIASANDACTAMAEFIAGSESAFVERMNEKALELGMTNTNFVNCCGLDAENHYSSALDIAKMSDYLLNNYPEIQEYTLTWMDTIYHETSKGRTEFGLTNTNKMIKYYNGITGLKTGSTSNAGYSVSSSAKRADTYYVAVVLGADSTKERFLAAGELLDYGFANGEVKKLSADELTQTISISGMQKSEYSFVSNEDAYIFLSGEESLEEIELCFEADEQYKEAKAGDNYGTLLIILDGNVIESVDMYAEEDVKKVSFFYYFKLLNSCNLFQ